MTQREPQPQPEPQPPPQPLYERYGEGSMVLLLALTQCCQFSADRRLIQFLAVREN